ncbi:uncharacterized protein LOC107273942 isoform X2 [Cephus cinctus]|uniref:Uncharacterized protein LOC107273942 isoform X2 n=1 Tax=Cephus cinctus TaxID=211228 RepID=A0AAJ7FTW8_CEPCN|nr:uncharacterized protein LOC107273942 isoform X2 [Cephus cinctus]
MKLMLLSNCMFHFSLRQGTIVIAISQIFLSGFCMAVLVLALAHAMETREMVAIDTEDALEREALEEISSKHLNTKRMDMGHHKATEELYLLYCVLVVTVIHFIATVLLLYGAAMNNRHFMAPWIMVKMTELVAGVISLFLVQENCPFIALIGGNAGAPKRVTVFIGTMVGLYLWFVVYSTYKSLEIKKGLTHEIHDPKKRPATPLPENSKLRASGTQPFEV